MLKWSAETLKNDIGQILRIFVFFVPGFGRFQKRRLPRIVETKDENEEFVFLCNMFI